MSIDLQKQWAERPLGMRDVYPQQAKLRRRIESRLLYFFEQNRFEMVSSGLFEYADTLRRGRSSEDSDDWLRLFDAAGRTVALRPEMTPSIARMAAPLFVAGTREIRWCYAERVFRRSVDPASLSWASGKAAESTQVGVEWIGQTGHEADAELVALCQNSIESLRLADWQMVVNHALFASSFLAAYGIPDLEVAELLSFLTRGDYVGFREQIVAYRTAANALEELASLDPLHPESLSADLLALWRQSEHGQRTLQYWNQLVEFGQVLVRRQLTRNLSFDLTLCRDMTYYTGIVFETFAPGVGAPIALGGRYDDLLSHFGAAAPAIGFTFEVERLLTAMTDGAWLVEQNGEEM